VEAILWSGELPEGLRIDLRLNHGLLHFRLGSAAPVRFEAAACAAGVLRISPVEPEPATENARLWAALLHGLFEGCPDLRAVWLDAGQWQGGLDALGRSGIALSPASAGEAAVSLRGMVRQRPEFWLRQARDAFPLHYTMTGEKRHPLRPPPSGGEVYSRHVPGLGLKVSFHTVDPDRHLDLFHRWMNDPRVANFWELAGSREDHRTYLDKALSDRHLHPVIGCFDDEPFGYFEIYWAKEDRIAPFYAADDFDRGVHMLVGEPKWRGPQRVAAWLPSLAHYLFLDDLRTCNVVAEPRADNAKMIGYLQQTGFFKQKEFDFPHKRAALMILPREVFFDQYCP
jgi:RimJ/RimL family protein N-acetyltransferase